MKYFLEPKGWPVEIDQAQLGLVARTRKGRLDLFFKIKIQDSYAVYNMTGVQTIVTGKVTPVVMKTNKD